MKKHHQCKLQLVTTCASGMVAPVERRGHRKHKPLAQRENGGRGAGYARPEELRLGMPLSLDSPLKRYPRIPKGSWNWHRGSDLDPLIISAHIGVLATVQGTLQGEVYISRFSLVSRSQTASSLHFLQNNVSL